MKKFNRSLYYYKQEPCRNCKSHVRRITDKRCIRCESNRYKKYYNKDYHAQYRKTYDIKTYQRKYYKGKHRTRNALNLSRLRQRLVFNDKAAIKAFYEACPKGYEVDHIVPLNGKYVSGLHTIHNLQYLTISQNRSKSNKYLHDLA